MQKNWKSIKDLAREDGLKMSRIIAFIAGIFIFISAYEQEGWLLTLAIVSSMILLPYALMGFSAAKEK